MYIYDTCRLILLRMKNIWSKICRENQNKFYSNYFVCIICLL